jgi:putative IMPACT (imprinted ancient) family translation regulator
VETRVEGSRFIATAFPASDEASARAGIEVVRSELPDATHHCWAFVLLGTGAEPLARSHDAGEPAGTAGPPIGQAIRRAGLINTVVVVTRYFGGTLLGKGGLARAYRGAASLALASAPSGTAVRLRRVRLSVPHLLDGQARHLVARRGGRVEAAAYDDPRRAVLDVAVPADALDPLRDDLSALAKGDLDVATLV